MKRYNVEKQVCIDSADLVTKPPGVVSGSEHILQDPERGGKHQWRCQSLYQRSITISLFLIWLGVRPKEVMPFRGRDLDVCVLVMARLCRPHTCIQSPSRSKSHTSYTEPLVKISQEMIPRVHCGRGYDPSLRDLNLYLLGKCAGVWWASAFFTKSSLSIERRSFESALVLFVTFRPQVPTFEYVAQISERDHQPVSWGLLRFPGNAHVETVWLVGMPSPRLQKVLDVVRMWGQKGRVSVGVLF